MCLTAEEYGIELNIKNVSLDFESAAINAFNENFPGISIYCCEFIFSQNIIRKINEFELKSLYSNDPIISVDVRKLKALGFVPDTEIVSIFEELKQTLDVRLKK